MSVPQSPNLIAGLLAIHAVVTRSLNVSAAKSGAFAQQGFADAALRDGFISYVKCLISVLGAHHKTEDEIAFPTFREKLDAPYDLLTQQHHELHPLLEEAKAQIERTAAEPDVAGPLVKLRQVLEKIEALWHPHIGIEEEHFTIARLASLMPPEEHVRLLGLFMQHMQQNTGPDYLIVPFLLYNSSPDNRAFFAGGMPPIVTQQLVPVVWKEKWAPMQPFLLT